MTCTFIYFFKIVFYLSFIFTKSTDELSNELLIHTMPFLDDPAKIVTSDYLITKLKKKLKRKLNATHSYFLLFYASKKEAFFGSALLSIYTAFASRNYNYMYM